MICVAKKKMPTTGGGNMSRAAQSICRESDRHIGLESSAVVVLRFGVRGAGRDKAP